MEGDNFGIGAVFLKGVNQIIQKMNYLDYGRIEVILMMLNNISEKCARAGNYDNRYRRINMVFARK